MLEEKNLYSLQDLVDLHEGTLEMDLLDVMEQFTRHIKGDCEVNLTVFFLLRS